jgi:phosphoribosylamine---glycine ligase
MRVLVLGSGAREHALAWKFARSHRTTGLFAAPGNAGTGELAINLPTVSTDDFDAVADAVAKHRIDIVFVGPEVPLAAGIVDHLSAAGISAIGPPAASARLESSKSFAKQFMERHDIPTPSATVCTSRAEVGAVFAKHPVRYVVKADGLAAGKGVFDQPDQEEAQRFALAHVEKGPVLLEQYLSGYEVSIFALTDGVGYRLLPACTDFKKAGDGDTGPNTGGLGAICPVPWVDQSLSLAIEERIVKPTFHGLREEGLAYSGVLYFGLMITEQGPYVLEYNVRFGDPEAQVLLPLLPWDLGNVAAALRTGQLDDLPDRRTLATAVGVVIAAPGYPGEYPTSIAVTSVPRTSESEAVVFHASTRIGSDGGLLTGGGRCFTVVGLGNSIERARRNAYENARLINFDGAWCRSDIAANVYHR